LRVLALGDSVTAGSKCSCDAFPRLYSDTLESTYHLSTDLANDGVPGAASQDVLSDLQSGSSKGDARQADVVLVTVGANDFTDVADAVVTRTCGTDDDLACARSRLRNLRTNLEEILARLQHLERGRPAVILVTGYWNVFEDGDVADADYSRSGMAETDKLTRAVNSTIAGVAQAAGTAYVDLYRPFKGAGGDQNPTSLLVDDGDHPNAAGHRVIARALVSAGLAPLMPGGR
jgi:lysophospholipase L1-like esterase